MLPRLNAILLGITLLLPGVADAQDKNRTSKYALLLASAAALAPFDEGINSRIATSSAQDVRLFQSSEKVLYRYGQPGVAVIALLTIGAGVVADEPKVTDTGIHTAEAIALTGIITYALKGTTGRERPNASPDDPYDFRWWGGWSGEGGASFPSGHASVTVAFASITSEELKLHYHELRKYVAPVLYGAAILTGVARMYEHKHWASDIALGSAIGYISGKVVFDLNHREAKR